MTTRVEDVRGRRPSQLTLAEKAGTATYGWTVDGTHGGGRVAPGDTVQILLPSPTQEDRVNRAIADESLTLIQGAARAASTTQKRLGQTFNSYLVMFWLLFGIGVLAVLAAVFRGFTAESTAEVVTTGLFVGLSATSFVASFLLRPTGSMTDAGVRAAWLQAVVTTFWTKLGYMTDPRRC